MPMSEKAKEQLKAAALRQKAERDYRRQVESELALLQSCLQSFTQLTHCLQDCRVLSVSCLKKRVKK